MSIVVQYSFKLAKLQVRHTTLCCLMNVHFSACLCLNTDFFLMYPRRCWTS